MATDRARRSYDPSRAYRSVVAQQGRVTVEADVNEAEEILTADSRAQVIDIVGPTGSPDDGFKVTVPGGPTPYDFALGAGTLYVGGMRIALFARETYVNQSEWETQPAPADDPDIPTAPSIKELAYLMVAEHEVRAVEDPALLEIALGGPDTAGRTRLLRQVRRSRFDGKLGCDQALAAILKKRHAGLTFRPDSMRLESAARLKVDHVPPPAAATACDPIASSGYLGDENQLIRVGVTLEGKCLWGYDNASFLHRAILKPDGITLVLEGIHVDELHIPEANQWVEVLPIAAELDPANPVRIAAHAGYGRAIAGYTLATRTMVLQAAVPAPLTGAAETAVFVRLWERGFDFEGDGTTPTALKTRRGDDNGVRVYTTAPPVPGDYWMIGVRPSDPSRFYPPRFTREQPPDGPARWVTPLATIAWNSDGKTARIHDCRHPFDSLTEDDDLAFHNQHLHGWGVVCGLQVRCMTTDYAEDHALDKPREWVTVANGYAIDPTGVDIRLREPEGLLAVELADLAADEGALDRQPNGLVEDGSVSLWIDAHGELHVDPYTPKTGKGWLDLLEGTLLGDIYRDCVLRVLDYLKDQIIPGTASGALSMNAAMAALARGDLTGGSPDLLVSAEGRRFTALFNLMWQLVNQTSGRHIYLSGDPAKPTALTTEDGLLRAFFNGLKELFQSKSFCAMFDDVQYPAYDVYRAGVTANVARPTTIFGTGRHARIRIHPKFPFAFTCGMGSRIHVYDRDKRLMIAAAEFPVTGATVQDVAFGPGREVYAIAWIGTSQTESSFATGVIANDGEIVWAGNEVTCQLKLVTLATFGGLPKRIFAAARGHGVVEFDAAAPSATPDLVDDNFQATGHLVAIAAGDKHLLFAGENTGDPNPVEFDQIRMLRAQGGGSRIFRVPPATDGPGLGEDIAVRQTNTATIDEVYAVCDGPTGSKRLLIWDDVDGGPPTDSIDLGQSSGCRIAFSLGAKWGLVTYFDSYLGRTYRPENRTLEREEFHPLQVGPVSIASDPRGEWFYVLEWLSNTITAIPAMHTGNPPTRPIVDAGKLEAYRVAALRAYLQLIRRFVQYLKDCACDHLLVNCPDPKGKKVYLADISFKDGNVYQICNFHNRRYVHTFPTVEYWMSIVPIIPFIKSKVEQLCCSVVSDFLGKYDPPDDPDSAAKDKVQPWLAYSAYSHLQAMNIKPTVENQRLQVYSGYQLGKKALLAKLAKPFPGVAAKPIAAGSFTGENVKTATAIAKTKGIEITGTRVVANPFIAAWNVGLSAPAVARGDAVELLTDEEGTVIGIARATARDAPVRRSRRGADEGDGPEIAKLRREIDAMRKHHESELADARKEMRDELKKELAKIKRPRGGARDDGDEG